MAILSRRVCSILCLLLTGSGSWTALAAAPEKEVNPSHYGVRKSGYTGGIVCKRCHTDIYQIWSHSMHAFAVSDPIFADAYDVAVAEGGKDARRLCLSCHSPTTRMTKDYSLREPLSNEGVTCDFCHTISRVDVSQPEPFTYDLGPTKRGVHKGMFSPAHFMEYSPSHGKSELCGGCHDFRSPRGVPVLETYSEWKASPYAGKGIQCQDCHMRRLKGMPLVNRQIELTSELAPDHAVKGGHSLVRLQEAATVGLQVDYRDQAIQVEAKVENVGSGHKVPTGAPTRRVVLEVSVLSPSGKTVQSQSRVYQKVLEDENGQPVTTMADSFVKAVRVASDNRLAPKQVRREAFTFRVPSSGEVAIVQALLTYKFVTPQGIMDVKMSEASRLVWLGPDFWQSPAGLQLRIALVVGLIAGLAVFVICRRSWARTPE